MWIRTHERLAQGVINMELEGQPTHEWSSVAEHAERMS
jgi:hypothetical protein